MALSYQKKIDPHTSFAVWKIEESIDELQSKLQLKQHEAEFLQSIHHDKRKLHWLSTRVLLRTMLNTDGYIDCRSDDQGKPFLVNFSKHISISHSGDYAAVMISDQSEVGIDIEHMSPKIVKLAPKFLSTKELSFINQTYQIAHLYVCWCAKEAIYKLHGKRGVSLLNDIHLKPFTYQERGKMQAELLAEGSTSILVVCFEKFDGYMISYVLGQAN
jgi:phosphopantetheine--protein transferase-like protein